MPPIDSPDTPEPTTFDTFAGNSAIACVRDSLSCAGLTPLKHAVRALNQHLADRFRADQPVDELIFARARGIDALLEHAWQQAIPGAVKNAALVAVGGYGRGELAPCSDVDIMILVATKRDSDKDWIAEFLTALWDSGLDIGHSVRTPPECRKVAADDLTIVTAMMESRLLAGDQGIFNQVSQKIAPTKMWSSKVFFKAKREEQKARYARYDDTGYNLEPNVKGSPGGLRDVQMIGWVANRHFGSSEFSELVPHRFLTPGQLKLLLEGRSFIWRVRFGLHLLTGRAEDRLLFDHQKQLAELLGYEDASFTLAVEQLMQRYYRTVGDLSRLNAMLLQLFEEAILLNPNAEPRILDEEFKLRNGYVQTRDEQTFKNNPSALLRIFLLLQENPEFRGISAYTVGLIKRNLHLINDEFRQSPKNQRLFLKIVSANVGVTRELRRMNLYGVLGLYIPAFGRIVGRMQFDLFHAYTVDEHTLFVVSHLRKFALARFDDELPHVSSVMQRLQHPELAYLSGLFHDIGKGRGGDHSKLGAVDAESFCLEHGLGADAAKLVAWQVRHHLLLSMTAQKKDLSDPAVIQKFAGVVRTRQRLDHLYVLTVADVRGTNPRLWNSWKASLFRELYELTSRALQRGLDDPADSDELIVETRAEAIGLLATEGFDLQEIKQFWDVLPPEYFLRYRSDEIAWHTGVLLRQGTENPTLDISIQDEAIRIFLYTHGRYHTFAHTTAVLDELGMDIEDARIVPASSGFSLDMYTVGNPDYSAEMLAQSAKDIRARLARVVQRSRDPLSEWQPKVTRRRSRRARVFDIKTVIRFVGQDKNGRTIVELDAADAPGLLSSVGEVFVASGIDIAMAKIVTIGEKAEDVFYVSDLEGKPLTEEAQQALSEALAARLRLADDST